MLAMKTNFAFPAMPASLITRLLYLPFRSSTVLGRHHDLPLWREARFRIGLALPKIDALHVTGRYVSSYRISPMSSAPWAHMRATTASMSSTANMTRCSGGLSNGRPPRLRPGSHARAKNHRQADCGPSLTRLPERTPPPLYGGAWVMRQAHSESRAGLFHGF